jgi:very-short-patch-repair endonuclease
MLVVAARSPTAERTIERLATRSYGIVTRRELLEAGVTKAEIEHRVANGALLREHHGVFRVGHRAPNIEATFMAAVRAGGRGALLCGCAAAHLYGLIKGPAPQPEILALGKRRVRRVRALQTRSIDPRDATRFRGIPITTVRRTLVDLAAALDGEALGRACHEAGIRYGTTPAEIRGVLERRPNSRGAAKLRKIIDGDERITLSRLERRFVELLRAAGLPLPSTNKRAGGRRVDCRWPHARLTVELDGYRYHHSRYAWERDRRREREARARGDEFRRYTWGDVYEEPAATIAELRGLLTR